jgi:hypothetical protein
MSKWDKRIQKAEKFLDKSWNHGRLVYQRYADDREDFALRNIKRCNLFYANVSTIKESLFNSLPKPDVGRLHRGDWDDDVARVAALIVQRGLDYEVQCSVGFEDAIKDTILNRLVPGVGQVWVRFEMKENPESVDQDGQPVEGMPTHIGGSESIILDSVYWEDFLYEPARSWQQVTWVGRKLTLTKADIVERWGEKALDDIQAVKTEGVMLTPKEIDENKYTVYEIWDKKKLEVLHIAKGREEPLDVKPDPYGLKGFFPCPKPLMANVTTNSFLPVTDYHIAQDQYNQLDVLYARMGLIIEAIKVAGVYNAASPEIGTMLQGQENKLVPVDNWAMFAESGGAAGMIQWYPVEQVVTVLQALQAEFEAIKGLLGEISGMADIIRGDSNQYETAQAQQIKAQFASTRMNGYQRDVASFVTGVLKIMAEMMTQLYSDEKLIKIVGTITEADQQFIPAAMQVLRDDFMSMYKVSIQADSMVQADWALEKGQRMELMGFVSQFLQSSVPAMATNPELGPLLLTMFKFTIMGYRGASEVEGVLDQQLDMLAKAAQNPQPKPPSPEEQKAQVEQQKMQMEAQIKQQEAQQQAQLKQQEAQQKMQIEQMQARADLAVEKQKMELQSQLQSQKMASDMAMQQQTMEFERQKMEMELAFKEREAQLKLSAASQQASIKAESAEHSAKLKKESQNGKSTSD